MTASTSANNNFFTRAVTAFAILGPMLLVVLAGTLPTGERGELIVVGHLFIVAALAVALALRGAYQTGFGRARKLMSSTPRRTQTA